MPTSQEILDTPMQKNDSGAFTIRGYIIALASEVWEHGEGFSGKRPFGNSGWHWDVYKALAQAGHVVCTFDEDGYVEDMQRDERYKADKLVADAIKALS